MADPRSPTPPRRLELKIESHPANLAPARRAIEDLAGECGFDEASRGEIGLVVNEALANVMRHAYGGATDRPIVIGAEGTGDTVRITMRDWGNGVNPQELPPKPRDPLTPGGLGMICLRQMMDEVAFTRQPDGMLLSMSRKKERTPEQGTCDGATV